MSEVQHQTIKVKGGEIAYELRGEGPPLLMIMGYLARGSGWSLQREALSQSYRVLTFDHVGVGDSPGESPKSMEGFVAHCVALLDAEGWDSAHVIGVSMGGMIAQHLALSEPERVRSLSLIVTHSGGLRSVIPPLRGLPHFFKAQLARNPRARHEALARLLIPAERFEQLDQEEVIQQIARDFSPRPPLAVRLAQLRAVLGHKTSDRVATLKAPTLLVSADQDLLVAPRHQRRLAEELPQAQLLRYAGAGHGLIRQADLDLSAQLSAHLSRAERALVTAP